MPTLEEVDSFQQLPGSPAGSSHQDDAEGSEDEHDDSVWWTPSELRDILDRSTALKVKGNAEFGKGQWEAAMGTYRDALVELPVRTLAKANGKGKERATGALAEGGEEEEATEDGVAAGELVEGMSAVSLSEKVPSAESVSQEGEEESQELRELRAVLFANVAACLLKLERWKDAVKACDDALEDDPSYVKALHRRAMASESIGSWSSLTSALSDYKTLQSLPNISHTMASANQKALQRLPGLIGLQQEKEKDEVLSKLKDLGNTVLGKFGLSTNNFKFVQQEGGGYSMNFER